MMRKHKGTSTHICKHSQVLPGNSIHPPSSPAPLGINVTFREIWEPFRAWKQGLLLHPHVPLSSTGAWSVCWWDSCHNRALHIVTLTHSNNILNECVNGARTLAFMSYEVSLTSYPCHLSSLSIVNCSYFLSNRNFASLFLRTTSMEFLQVP